MKRIFTLLIAALAFSLPLIADDIPQKTPAVQSILKSNILKQNLRIFQKVKAIQIVNGNVANGVVADYDRIYKSIQFKNNKPDFLGPFAGLDNSEYEEIFITGLNHETITTKGLIYHFEISGDFFLYAWPIGIQDLHVNTKPIRLKKFTVDINEAIQYYKPKKLNTAPDSNNPVR